MQGEKRKILSVADSKLGLYKDINHCTYSFRYDGCLYFTTYILNALYHWKICANVPTFSKVRRVNIS